MIANCFLFVGQVPDQQTLYFYERPKFTFQHTEWVGHVQVLPEKDPKWSVVSIELPTMLLEHTKQWIESKDTKDLRVGSEIGGNITEIWEIKSAMVISYGIQRSRVLPLKVVNANLTYKWARRL
jgi:hypothetical protein